jgi:glycosyltransferase involved in cell wall biosynthesis
MGNNNAVAVFMGYGPLEKLIKSKAKNSKKIFFLPAVPPNEVLKYTASADYGFSLIEDICLSYKYCLPNKLFEYLMAEIPVIVSNLPEQKKIVEKYKVGVVVRENTPEGLREAVGEILRLDRDELVRNIKKVKKFFNWENQEKILLNVYRDL